MTKSELYALLTEPELVRPAHIPELEQLIKAYPYASSFVFLYLYALGKSEDVRYEAELKRLALYLPSRERLFRLLYDLPSARAQAEKQSNDSEDSFGLIDSYLESLRSEGEDLPEDLSLGSGEHQDYFASEEGSNELEPSLLGMDSTEPQPSRPQSYTEATIQSEEDPQELFTETLARIYVQQGKYERALAILEQLNLHYPQKNRYFADQIRFLKRLVENNNANKES